MDLNLQRPFDACLYDWPANLSSSSEEVKYKKVFNRQLLVTCKMLSSSIKPNHLNNELQDAEKAADNGQKKPRAT